ncbi:uncharacterized protein LOC127103519 [Lathyrus oleraceus]|uniref:uncharacterized protein LOC127103519 n=1 Tax=Pisum sativum TaxID=3888 RepID=UPI0021D13602|nr:uncharacterized protein LOC127103519 [Pisum sativum]
MTSSYKENKRRNMEQFAERAVDVGNQYKSEQEFKSRDQMLQWIRMEASKLGFGVVIGRSDNGSDRICAFVTMTYERSGNIKLLSGFSKETTLVQENLMLEEKGCIADMTLNLVQPKNILATLKWKKPENISNSKQVYNIRYQTNKALMGDRTEMLQLLKLLDDNSYMSRYRTCDDGFTVRDIFWTHPDSIKLFNTFPTVLILDSTCKTNKYRLPLLEMVGVTSTKKTYSVGFAFLECDKKDNFTWALEVCHTLLKDQGDVPKVIVTDHNTSLIKLVAKVFPSSNALLYRYHLTKNARSQVKPTVGTKEIESEDGKMVKVKEKIICARTDNVRHLRNTTTNKVESAHATLKIWLGNSSDNAKYGFTIVKIDGLPCACVIAKKVKLGSPIRMDEVCIHWKRLRFDDDGVMNDGKYNISILTEWEVIQDIFLKFDDNMKLHIKEQLRKIAYPETTDMKPPSQPI